MELTLFQKSAIASNLVSPEQLAYVQRLARHRLLNGTLSIGQADLDPRDATGEPQPLSEEQIDRIIADLLVEQNTITRYQADQLLAGRTKLTLGPYLVTDWIGQGGMGQVYKAVHQVMGRECAVKVLPLTKANDESRDSFMREIRMQAELDCTYLVRAFDAGQDGNVHYLVTEFIPGMDLRRLVRAEGPLNMQQAARVIMHAALGLDYAHGKGLVHRDIKPGNILVTPDGNAKVSDIGLAGFAMDLVSDPRAGKVVGTLDYLSPEQIKTPLDVKPVSDIYSLGCTLYYAVCGKVPFPGGDAKSKIRRHLSETPWHPRKFAPDLSEDFIDIIADMMEKDPAKRVHSANEVVLRLEPWVSDAHSLHFDPLSPSAWLAPPIDEDTPPVTSVPNAQQDSNYRLENIESDGGLSRGQSSEVGNLPIELARQTVADLQTLKKPTAPWMLVAMTVAIVLPPAMLIGAILGFLIRNYLE